MKAGDHVLLLDSRGKTYLITLKAGGEFHHHGGVVAHDSLIGKAPGSKVNSSKGEELSAFYPRLWDFVLKMPRGAQVVYPKDQAAIIFQADVCPGARVVEAGAGSGALSIALLRAVGPRGRLTTYEVREDFAEKAGQNVNSFLGRTENFEIRIADVYEGIAEHGLDRVILDVPEPWRAAPHAVSALAPGGIVAAYVPTVMQIQRFVSELRDSRRWAMITTTETLLRGWHVSERSIRPEHRMVAHTGFVTTARLTAP